MKHLYIAILFAIFMFATIESVAATSLNDIKNNTGVEVFYGSGLGSELNINNPFPGVYEVKRNADNFPCTPGIVGCEPDRYEVRLSKNIPHIFGLGMQASANQVEIQDFIDTSFGYGHCLTPQPNGNNIDFFETDICRLRTPIFVLPQENIIIVYLQPEVKKLRLTRDGQYGCPIGSTCMVLKKYDSYSEGKPAPLTIIKGTNPANMYELYYQYLKSKGFYFKNPDFRTFGVHWETWNEFVSTATATNLLNVVQWYKSNKIDLSTITIGSGYWGSTTYTSTTCPENCIGCGVAETGCPATDSLITSSTKYPPQNGNSGLTTLFGEFINQGIYPMIGMRHRIQQGITGFDNLKRIVDIFHQSPYSVPTNIPILWGGDNSPHTIKVASTNYSTSYMLDITNPLIQSKWIDIIRDAYGPFKGIKGDDMGLSDQKRLDLSQTNIPDNFISGIYKVYNQKYNNDFVIFGRNDWISTGTDAQSIQGWLDKSRTPNLSYTGYQIKYYLDSSLTQITSGYPHPRSELGDLLMSDFIHGDTNILPSEQKMFTRSTQLSTFWPAMNQSRLLSHITDSTLQNTAVWFSQLKNRLNQYSYDQSQKWYRTGIPTLMQPLYIGYGDDPEISKQYSFSTNDFTIPKDEFMYGNAMLIRPVFSDNDTFQVYLPEGTWRPFMQTNKPTIFGKRYIDYTISTSLDYPIFIKANELLVIANPNNHLQLEAYFFLDNVTETNEYVLTKQSGEQIKLRGIFTNNKYYVKNTQNNLMIESLPDQYGKGFQIANINSLLSATVPGDINSDGKIDLLDFGVWKTKYLAGKMTLVDFGVWKVAYLGK